MSWTPGRKIAHLIRLGRDLRYWVGIPLLKPARWSEVFRVDESGVATVDGDQGSLADVRAWSAAYRNDEIFELEGILPPVPGLVGLSRTKLDSPDTITEADLRRGRRRIVVSHGPCALPWRDGGHFSTRVQNVGTEPIRITGFAPYGRLNSGQIMTPFRFSASQFRAWYDLGMEEWIPPGKGAWDPANYSGPGILWAYRGVTREGEPFVSGEVSP
ncbi:MAG: hypothetical protein IT452_04605 [Planctomycetia bacterium]|nr:hypothetical protein [Planctomycetia bacterium]